MTYRIFAVALDLQHDLGIPLEAVHQDVERIDAPDRKAANRVNAVSSDQEDVAGEGTPIARDDEDTGLNGRLGR